MSRSLWLVGVCVGLLARGQTVASGQKLTVTTPNAVATFQGPDLVGFQNALTGDSYLKLPSTAPMLNVDTLTPTGQPLASSDWTTVVEPNTGITVATLAVQDSSRSASLIVKVDPTSQEIVVRLAGQSSRAGVKNASWGIAGFDLSAGRLLVPAHSGLALDQDHNGAGSSFNYPSDWHAQMFVYESAKGTMVVYASDTQMLFKKLKVASRSASTIDVALLTEAAAPWQAATTVTPVEWRLRAVAGDWKLASQAYRTWLQINRSSLLVDSPAPWVPGIHTVVTVWMVDQNFNFKPDPTLIDRIVTQHGNSYTMLYFPVWRNANSDHDLPDYTPAPGLAQIIARAHAYGMPVMLSASAYSMSPGNRDYASLRGFQAKDPETGELVGYQWNQPAGVKTREAYINPASSAYRKLLVSRLAPVLNSDVPGGVPDALHFEKAAVTFVNDANGLVEAQTFPQGAVQLFADITKAYPGLVLSAEGMNDILYTYHTFAQAWWGNPPTDPVGHPIASFLFNPKVLYTSNASQPAATDPGFKQFMKAAERRAIQPNLVVASFADLDFTNGDNARLLRQLRAWEAYLMQPAWTTADWGTAAVRYTGCCGLTLALTDDGTLTKFAGNFGTVYTRARGVNSYDTSAFAPNWPAYDTSHLSGLDSASDYWLEPVAKPSSTHILNVPAGVKLGVGTMITPKFVYVELAPDKSPVTGGVTIPMIFDGSAPAPTHSGDGILVPVALGSANVTGVPVPGRFVEFLTRGTDAPAGSTLDSLPFEIWRAAAGELPASNEFWGVGKLLGVGKVGTATSAGVDKLQAIYAYPENGRTILSWVLRLPDSPMQFSWTAGLADGGISDTGVEFSVRVNGFEYWKQSTKVNGWNTGNLDLSLFKGQTVLVQLVTDSLGNSNFDNAYWADLNMKASTSTCTYAIPATASAPFSGNASGSFAITTAAGCAWAVTVNVPWISITSSNVGVGPGTVTYSVAANGGPARTGAISVGAQTLTVTQAAGEAPVFTSLGITNGASFVPGMVAGSITTLFGTRLSNAQTPVSASSIPLPKVLADTSVTVNGIQAPLYFVSPAQVNFQAPWEVQGQRTVSVVVTSNGRSSEPVPVSVLTALPGIFTYADGTTAIAFHSNFTFVTPASPAAKGEVLILYATVGAVAPPTLSGEAASATTLSNTTVKPVLRSGLVEADVLFSGLAAGFVGLYQVNFRVPLNFASGNVDLTMQVSGQNSRVVTLAVQ